MEVGAGDVEAVDVGGKNAGEEQDAIHDGVMAEASEHHDSDGRDYVESLVRGVQSCGVVVGIYRGH